MFNMYIQSKSINNQIHFSLHLNMGEMLETPNEKTFCKQNILSLDKILIKLSYSPPEKLRMMEELGMIIFARFNSGHEKILSFYVLLMIAVLYGFCSDTHAVILCIQ